MFFENFFSAQSTFKLGGYFIADFQETRFKLARMASEIEAARQLMYHVATQFDNNQRLDKEAAMLKWFSTEMAERVTSDALQIFGGAGYTNSDH